MSHDDNSFDQHLEQAQQASEYAYDGLSTIQCDDPLLDLPCTGFGFMLSLIEGGHLDEDFLKRCQ